ncbi:MAG: Cof-type HAD-IIB family hydrolase [Spirochaetota bacterium]
MIHTIITDLDGTLLDKQQRISILNQQTLQKAIDAKLNVIFATGRRLRATLKLAEYFHGNITIISNNGQATSYFPHNLMQSSEYFEPSQIEFVVNVMQKKKLLPIFHVNFFLQGIDLVASRECQDPVYLSYLSKKEENIAYKDPLQIQDTVENVLIICYLCSSYKKLEQIQLECKAMASAAKLKTVLTRIPGVGPCLEFLPSNISKWSAIEKFLLQNKLPQKGTISFGDELNDMEMIQNAEIGVAMNNADSRLKKEANIISQFSNQESAVAKELLRLKIL